MLLRKEMKIIIKNTGFYNIEDVCLLLNCGKTTGYKYIKKLNKELEEKGYLTRTGRVSAKYFNERFYDFTENNK